MKQTVLEMVQTILSSLDAEEVNSIDDTVEATQVALILKNTYLNMASNRDWSSHKKLTVFNHSGTPDKPTHLKSPENLKELITFRYNTSKESDGFEFNEVKYIYPDEFLRLSGNRNKNSQNTKLVQDFGGTWFSIVTNKGPSYWTSFDDEYVVCDSYDITLDDALKSSKTQIHAMMFPSFEMVDGFIPDMPVEAFAGLIAEAKSVAFVEVKQLANQKAEQEASRQRVWLSRKEWSLKGGVRYPDFGRKRIK